METKRSAGSLALKAVLALFFLFAVLLPLIRMLSNMATTDVGGILSSPQFHSAALHSLLSSGTATLISVFLAFLLAWCITRSRIRFKEAWCVLFTLPMLIPSISHGMGLVILFGSNGILTNWLHLPFTIYGFGGIVIGSVLYSFPVAFLMLLDVLKYEDGTAYEAAAVLGISKGRQIRSLLLPYLRKPLISVIFATFTLIVTDYGVPLMVGGKYMTLPVMMYNEVTGLLDFGEGSVIGACLLIPAVAAFLIDLFTKESNGQNFVTRPRSVAPGRGRGCVLHPVVHCRGCADPAPYRGLCAVDLCQKVPRRHVLHLPEHLKNHGSRRGRLSDKLPDHRLFRRLDRYGGFLSHRLSDSPFPRDILRAAPPHLHHFPSHPRYGAGPLLFLVLRRAASWQGRCRS